MEPQLDEENRWIPMEDDLGGLASAVCPDTNDSSYDLPGKSGFIGMKKWR